MARHKLHIAGSLCRWQLEMLFRSKITVKTETATNNYFVKFQKLIDHQESM
jgi:hypothetical protein